MQRLFMEASGASRSGEILVITHKKHLLRFISGQGSEIREGYAALGAAR